MTNNKKPDYIAIATYNWSKMVKHHLRVEVYEIGHVGSTFTGKAILSNDPLNPVGTVRTNWDKHAFIFIRSL